MLKIKRFVGFFFQKLPFFLSYDFTSFSLFIQFFFFFRLCTYTMLMYYRGHFLCSGSCYIARVAFNRAVYFYSQNGIYHMKKKKKRQRTKETGEKSRDTPLPCGCVCVCVVYRLTTVTVIATGWLAWAWMAFSYYCWGNVKLPLVSSPRPNVCRHIKH